MHEQTAMWLIYPRGELTYLLDVCAYSVFCQQDWRRKKRRS
jgi:hypothetical protein